MRTVAVLEGWAGGPKVSGFFRKKLQETGFSIIKPSEQADFIIAHSTGCYMLPKNIKARAIILIDPPYWPGESIARRWINMSKDELKYLLKAQGAKRFWRDKFWEVYYVFAKPSYTLSVLRNQSHMDFLRHLSDKKVILVRNRQDEFCSPQVQKLIRSYTNVMYTEVDGFHGHYYLEPQPYIDLLLKELK